jgi:hypothetical protein
MDCELCGLCNVEGRDGNMLLMGKDVESSSHGLFLGFSP